MYPLDTLEEKKMETSNNSTSFELESTMTTDMGPIFLASKQFITHIGL